MAQLKILTIQYAQILSSSYNIENYDTKINSNTVACQDVLLNKKKNYKMMKVINNLINNIATNNRLLETQENFILSDFLFVVLTRESLYSLYVLESLS